VRHEGVSEREAPVKALALVSGSEELS